MATLQGGTQSFAGGVSESWTTPFPHALGTKARDSEGNEYVLCSTGALTTVAPEMVVLIGANWNVTPITEVGGQGPIGVVADYAKRGNTSAFSTAYPAARAIWVQIYGRAYIMYGGGGTSPSEHLLTTVRTSLGYRFHIPTSTASTPVGQPFATSANIGTTLSDYLITGMTVATDATIDVSGASVLGPGGTTLGLGVTKVSATHSGSVVAVWLNYPQAEYGSPDLCLSRGSAAVVSDRSSEGSPSEPSLFSDQEVGLGGQYGLQAAHALV